MTAVCMCDRKRARIRQGLVKGDVRSGTASATDNILLYTRHTATTRHLEPGTYCIRGCGTCLAIRDLTTRDTD